MRKYHSVLQFPDSHIAHISPKMIFRSTLVFLVVCAMVSLQAITVDGKINVYNEDKERVKSYNDEEAVIGEILIQAIQGYIEVAKPEDACTKIAEPTVKSNYSSGRFILINGTDKCTYMLKVKNAQRAGFDIAVVFDPFPKPYTNNHSMPFPTPQMKIPLLFISYKDGIEIRERYRYRRRILNNYVVEIVPNYPHSNNTLMILLVVGVVVVCFVLLLLIGFGTKYFLQRRRNRYLKEFKIIHEKYKEHRWNQCVICHKYYEEGDDVLKLPCGHFFDYHCIKRWLSKENRCPLCNLEVVHMEETDLTSQLSSEREPLINVSAASNPTFGTFPDSNPSTSRQSYSNYFTSDPGTSAYSANDSACANHSRIRDVLGSESNHPSTSQYHYVNLCDVQIRSFLQTRDMEHSYLNK